MRTAGILLPLFSLPGPWGAGTTRDALPFLDFLARAGVGCWQMLPPGPVVRGASPYQSPSAFAGNPLFISPDDLAAAGLLTPREAEGFRLPAAPSVDWPAAGKSRARALSLAFSRFAKRPLPADWGAFLQENAYWLAGWAAWAALADTYGADCALWPPLCRLSPGAYVDAAQSALSGPLPKGDISADKGEEDNSKERAEQKTVEPDDGGFIRRVWYHAFCQYAFSAGWRTMAEYAGKRGIALLGDLPIYVCAGGADTWQHPGLFELDSRGEPTAVAGCPPDAFSRVGQLWNNPLYNWAVHEAEGFSWWRARARRAMTLFAGARMDHFRGFESYWAVPAGAADARGGAWQPGPGERLFHALEKELGSPLPLYAEDLGDITPAVHALRRGLGMAGMNVLQFAFSPDGASIYLPHRHEENSVVFTGTHDNDTLAAWACTAPEGERAFAARYLGVEGQGPTALARAVVQAALSSPARLAVLPLQDILPGGGGRMNTPGTVGPDNWSWRLLPGQATDPLAAHLRKMLQETGRLGEER